MKAETQMRELSEAVVALTEQLNQLYRKEQKSKPKATPKQDEKHFAVLDNWLKSKGDKRRGTPKTTTYTRQDGVKVKVYSVETSRGTYLVSKKTGYRFWKAK